MRSTTSIGEGNKRSEPVTRAGWSRIGSAFRLARRAAGIGLAEWSVVVSVYARLPLLDRRLTDWTEPRRSHLWQEEQRRQNRPDSPSENNHRHLSSLLILPF